MRLLLVVNSYASSVTARSRVVIQKALSADHEVTAVETSRRGHATRFAQDAATRGLDAVIVLGGDGTLNEAANGLIGSATALAPLPGGSTNVFARTIGYPNDPVEATGVLVDSLARGQLERIGVGLVNGRAFLFHTGIGFDAAVVREVERRGGLKRWAGHPLFIWAALQTWGRQRRRPGSGFTVEFANGDRIERSPFAICLNTNPYTYLGNRPFDIAQEATLDRGLVMVTFRKLSASAVGRAGFAALRSKPLPTSRAFEKRIDLTSMVVSASAPFPYQVDGDYLGEIDRLELAHRPDALTIIRGSTT
ncbi:MAG: diacylglycerol kinase family protein [Acidimicrobiia bacterium]